MTKERNYTIEFYRFMLAINFCLVHVLLVFPMFVFGSEVPFFAAGLDVIVPFMAVGKVNYLAKNQSCEEAGRAHYSPYPWLLANDSDFDICGFPTPQLAYRKIVWGSSETALVVQNPQNHGKEEIISLWGWPEVLEHYTFPGMEGKPIKACVYSGADMVRLTLNGQEIGCKKVGKKNRSKAELLGHANSSVTETVYVEVRKEAKVRLSEALMNPFGLDYNSADGA